MIALLAVGWLMAFPARANRIAFYQAELRIEQGWTKAQVRALLGPPDEVVNGTHLGPFLYQGCESWCYGTEGPGSLPALGVVIFEDGVVGWSPGSSYWSPPPLSVIDDAELDRHLRKLWRPHTCLWQEDDPLFLIRAANDLRPLGKEKAVAVMKEFCRVSGPPSDDLFWVARVLFAPKDPPGYFPVPALGLISPSPPRDLRSWPDFPMLVTDDVPFSVYEGALLRGSPESFYGYAERNQKDWAMATRNLRPLDDPFPALEEASRKRATHLKGYGSIDSLLLAQSLSLVRTVVPEPQVWAVDEDSQERESHGAFLRAGGHWDEQSQTYVPRNGKPLPDRTDYRSIVTDGFRQVPRVEFGVKMQRLSADRVWVSVDGTYHTTFRYSLAVFRIVEASSGRQLAWFSVGNNRHYSSPEEALAERRPVSFAGASGDDYGYGNACEVDANQGTRMRVVLESGGRRFVGRPLRP